MTEEDEFSQPIIVMDFEQETGADMATIWHLYQPGRQNPESFASEAAARRAATSGLEMELQQNTSWVPSPSHPDGYDLMLRVYGGRKKETVLCTIAPAPLHK